MDLRELYPRIVELHAEFVGSVSARQARFRTLADGGDHETARSEILKLRDDGVLAYTLFHLSTQHLAMNARRQDVLHYRPVQDLFAWATDTETWLSGVITSSSLWAGLHSWETGNYIQAIADFRHGLDFEPQDPDLARHLAAAKSMVE